MVGATAKLAKTKLAPVYSALILHMKERNSLFLCLLHLPASSLSSEQYLKSKCYFIHRTKQCFSSSWKISVSSFRDEEIDFLNGPKTFS